VQEGACRARGQGSVLQEGARVAKGVRQRRRALYARDVQAVDADQRRRGNVAGGIPTFTTRRSPKMTFTYQRQYRGKIAAVLLDWAGTTMDYGCMAPAVVFVEVYKRQGVPITMDEARAPMGAHKRVHIQKIGQLDTVRERWQKAHGRLPTDADVDRMFAEFVPLQLDCLSQYSAMIPGALEAVAAMRSRGMKIGSTTGYLREMME